MNNVCFSIHKHGRHECIVHKVCLCSKNMDLHLPGELSSTSVYAVRIEIPKEELIDFGYAA